jgi:hypothetical protein
MRQLNASSCVATHMIEVITPRTNAARLSPAEHLFAAIGAHAAMDEDPVAFEIAGDKERRRFLVRTGSRAQQQRVAAQFGAAYPQASLRSSESTTLVGDPAQLGPDEQAVAATLRLRVGAHLPLRTFEDRELDATATSAQADPLLGVLGAMANLPTGWRTIAQLVVVRPAPADWARAYQRLALERPLEQDRSKDSGPSLLGPLSLLGLLMAYLVGANVMDAWSRGDWPAVLSLAAAIVGVGIAGVLLVRWFRARDLVDPKLVQAKLARDACEVELRLAVFAPHFVEPATLDDRLQRLAAAYRPYSLAAGNSLIAKAIRSADVDLRVLEPLSGSAVLNVRELAGLWHLVQADDDVSMIERTTARRRLPLPASVASGPSEQGCRIGTSDHQGNRVPVYLHDALLRRHLLAVAKTRRGKSSLLLRLAEHLMRANPRALVLVDPHRDLAAAALGLVPPERRGDVVYLDLSNRRRPFGLNLLDVGLGWDRDQAVSNALRIFRREFDGFWGPRMEDAFRFALMALFEANQSVCWADPRMGRSSQHTILEVPALLSLRGFRRRVLKQVSDASIKQWFDDYFDALDTRLRLEVINPVQTKVHRYLGSLVARQIVGQPRSTIDFRQFVAERKIVLINLNAFDVGEDVAALIGGTLLNLAARAVSAQSALPPEQRESVTLIVDEFHTIPGADYEQICGELAKYGANLVLATQTLSRLDTLTTAQQVRDLRAAVFSNLDGLFAFHTSAEDARYLAPELGGGLEEQDLLELGHFQCYARVSDMRTGERLPAFTVQLDPPPVSDSAVAAELARASAEQYGREALDVELDRQTALARMDGARRREAEVSGSDGSAGLSWPTLLAPGSGLPMPDGTLLGAEVPEDPSPKPAKKRRARQPKGGGSANSNSSHDASAERRSIQSRETQ